MVRKGLPLFFSGVPNRMAVCLAVLSHSFLAEIRQEGMALPAGVVLESLESLESPVRSPGPGSADGPEGPAAPLQCPAQADGGLPGRPEPFFLLADLHQEGMALPAGVVLESPVTLGEDRIDDAGRHGVVQPARQGIEVPFGPLLFALRCRDGIQESLDPDLRPGCTEHLSRRKASQCSRSIGPIWLPGRSGAEKLHRLPAPLATVIAMAIVMAVGEGGRG